MPFNVKELSTMLEGLRQANDGSWMLAIGCVPGSVHCPNLTQPGFAPLREDPVDFRLDPKGSFDFAILKEELTRHMQEIEALEQALARGGEPGADTRSRDGYSGATPPASPNDEKQAEK